MAGKVCAKCGFNLKLSEFPRNKNGVDGFHSICKECKNAQARKRLKDIREGKPVVFRKVGGVAPRERHLLATYGITEAQYNDLLKKQDSKCAVCKRSEKVFKNKLSVDHDHVTGEIRGLLCSYCNYRVVNRHRKGGLLAAAAEYVEKAGTGLFIPGKKKKRKE